MTLSELKLEALRDVVEEYWMYSDSRTVAIQRNYPEEYRKFIALSETYDREGFKKFVNDIQNSPALGVLFSNTDAFKRCFEKYEDLQKVITNAHPANVWFLNMNLGIFLVLLENRVVSLSAAKQYEYHLHDEQFWDEILRKCLVDDKTLSKLIKQQLSRAKTFVVLFNNKTLSDYVLDNDYQDHIQINLSKDFLESFSDAAVNNIVPKAVEDIRDGLSEKESKNIQRCFKFFKFFDSNQFFDAVDRYATKFKNKFSDSSNFVKRLVKNIILVEYALSTNDYLFFSKHLNMLNQIRAKNSLFHFSNYKTFDKLLDRDFINRNNIKMLLKFPPHLYTDDRLVYKELLQDSDLSHTHKLQRLLEKDLVIPNDLIRSAFFLDLENNIFYNIKIFKMLFNITNELEDETLDMSERFMKEHSWMTEEDFELLKMHQYLNAFKLDQTTSQQLRRALDDKKISILRSIVSSNLESLYSFSEFEALLNKDEKKKKIKLNF